MNYSEYLPLLLATSEKAGQSILDIYHTADFGIETKADDSPLTLADRKSHQIIAEALEDTPFPILSEEGRDIPYEERKSWDYYWCVDPLDGTKEFIKKNGEFTVNIALIAHNRPIMGIIHAPVLHETYWGMVGEGANWQGEDGKTQPLQATAFTMEQAHHKVVGSRSHSNPKLQEYLKRLKSYEIYSMGSSLKFMLIAKGEADLYPRTGPTMEWDTAAAEAILVAAGGMVIRLADGQPLDYNKPNLLNPEFLAQGKLGA